MAHVYSKPLLPKCFLPSLQKILQDDSCNSATLSNPCPISDEEASPLVVLKDHLVLLQAHKKILWTNIST